MQVYYCGLDLGQKRDYTAFTILEELPPLKEPKYALRYIERFRDQPYPAIVRHVNRMFRSSELYHAQTLLAVDATGVGQGVVDYFRELDGTNELAVKRMLPICITAGASVTAKKGVVNVPKQDLVAAVQRVLFQGRLAVAPSLPHARTLRNELENFEVATDEDSGRASYNGRVGEHDDLVLSLAMALWMASTISAVKPEVRLTIGDRRRA